MSGFFSCVHAEVKLAYSSYRPSLNFIIIFMCLSHNKCEVQGGDSAGEKFLL